MFSCGTTPLVLRSVDFMTPHVSEKPLSGYLRAAVNFVPTQVVTATNAMTPAPATDINFKRDAAYMTGFLDAGVSLLPHFELYSIDKGLGAKWQFWSSEKGLEAAVKSGIIAVKYNTTNSNAATVSYNASGIENGLSLGYRFAKALPYLSYVKKTYTADTTTPNGSSTNKGTHQTTAIGLQFLDINPQARIQLSCVLEVSFTNADWDPNYSFRADGADWGVSLGGAW